MRALIAIGAAFVMACLIPAPSRADAPGPGVAAAKPDCKCSRVRAHRAVRHPRVAKRMFAAVPPPDPFLGEASRDFVPLPIFERPGLLP